MGSGSEQTFTLYCIIWYDNPSRAGCAGLRAGIQWKFESCSLSDCPKGNDENLRNAILVCKALGLDINFSSPTIPNHNRWVEFFVDSYFDFYSDLILGVQERKACVNFLAAYGCVIIGKVLLLANVSGWGFAEMHYLLNQFLWTSVLMNWVIICWISSYDLICLLVTSKMLSECKFLSAREHPQLSDVFLSI